MTPETKKTKMFSLLNNGAMAEVIFVFRKFNVSKSCNSIVRKKREMSYFLTSMAFIAIFRLRLLNF